MNIEQQWQAAVEEFGDDAFKRFKEPASNKGAYNHPEFNNKSIEIALSYNEEIELKPMPELFTHEIPIKG